jgi:hypothetical protein
MYVTTLQRHFGRTFSLSMLAVKLKMSVRRVVRVCGASRLR